MKKKVKIKERKRKNKKEWENSVITDMERYPGYIVKIKARYRAVYIIIYVIFCIRKGENYLLILS